MRNDGVPIVGFNWFSLTDQTDWDSALRERNNNVNSVGLFDLDRNIRPVGTAFKQLIADWRDVLPTQSLCLTVPVVMPVQSEGQHAQDQQARAREINESKARLRTNDNDASETEG